MPKSFGIFSPKHGLAESFPGLLLSEAYLQDGSVNIHNRYGEYHAMRGRLAEFLDLTNGAKIALPTDVFTISGIVTGTKTITITGDHSAGTTALTVGATIRVNGGTTEANNIEFTVASLPTTSTIVVSETISAAGGTAGNVFVGTTPIIRYHRHVSQNTNTEYILCATGYHIWLWGYSDRSFTVKHTCASVCLRWEMVTHMHDVYATNNVDKVLWWNVSSSAGNSFAVLDNASGLDIDGGSTFITKAKHLTSFEEILIVGFVTDSASNVHRNRMVAATQSSSGATIDFQYSGGSGTALAKDFSNTPAGLMGFARSGNHLIVASGPDAKQGRIYRVWLTTQTTVFEYHEEPLKVGALSADSFVNSKDGRLFWLATDLTIRELNTAEPISKLVDVTVRGVNTSVAEYAQATFIDRYNYLAFSIPSGSSERNDAVLYIEADSLEWYKQDAAVRAFADYTQQAAFTYDSLPYSSYEDWGAGWLLYDTDANVAGFPLDLASDYSGYTYDLFRADTDGGVVTSSIIRIGTVLDAKKTTIHRFKRVNNGIDLYFNTEASGEVDLEVKLDHAKTWQTVGTAPLIDSDSPEVVVAHVPCDLRAKYFEFQLSSDDYFEFLGMAFIEFEIEGTR